LEKEDPIIENEHGVTKEEFHILSGLVHTNNQRIYLVEEKLDAFKMESDILRILQGAFYLLSIFLLANILW